MPAAVLFDLDGTLIDSAPDIAAAANRMLAEAGAAPLSLAEVKGFIGDGVAVLVQRIVAARGLPAAAEPALRARFLALYEADAATLTRPWPGVAAALGRIAAAGHPMAVCTNKPERPARAILAALGLDPFFAVVVGGDSLARRKPDPAPLRHAAAALGAHSAVLVGDGEADAAAAAAAGIPFVLYTEGYRKSPVEALPHAARFADFAALPGLLADLLAGMPATVG